MGTVPDNESAPIGNGLPYQVMDKLNKPVGKEDIV